jgi:hypothetical protein
LNFNACFQMHIESKHSLQCCHESQLSCFCHFLRRDPRHQVLRCDILEISIFRVLEHINSYESVSVKNGCVFADHLHENNVFLIGFQLITFGWHISESLRFSVVSFHEVVDLECLWNELVHGESTFYNILILGAFDHLLKRYNFLGC